MNRRSVLAGGAALIGTTCLSVPAAAQAETIGLISAVDRWEDADLAGFELRIEEDDSGGTATESAPQGTEGSENESENETVDAEEDVEDATAEDGGEDGEAAAPQCDFRDWPPDSVTTYDAVLVNRKSDEGTPEESTTLRAGADADIEPNDVFLINNYQRCGDGDYVGVALEHVGTSEGEGSSGADDAQENVEDNEAQNDTGRGTADVGGGDTESGGADGPGFGVLGAIAAAAGLGGLLSRRRDD